MTIARRLTRGYLGSALGMLGAALVALSDHVLGIPTDAVQRREIWPD